jgi:hypothetical protein
LRAGSVSYRFFNVQTPTTESFQPCLETGQRPPIQSNSRANFRAREHLSDNRASWPTWWARHYDDPDGGRGKYPEALERAQKEFGVTGSRMSLVRFYQRVAAERAQQELLELDDAVKEMKGMDVNINEMKSAAMCLITKRLMKLSLESPDKVKEMAWLGQVLVAHEAQDVKRGWLNIGREKFELSVAKERAEDPPEALAGEEDYAAEDAEVLKIRKHLFGTNLPE